MSRHVWIKQQQALGQICIARTAEPHEKFAAAELARYFEKISGVRPPVVAGIRRRAKPSIILLDAARPSQRALLAGLPLDALKWDGFMIQSRGPDVWIVSWESSGLVFGVYQYLARVLGVRFYDNGPEGEDIPYADTLAHAGLNIIRNPRLPYRGLQDVLDIRRMDWMIRNGFNYVRYNCTPALEWWDEHLPILAVELKKRGLKIAFGHHLFDKTIPESLYLDEHPEYFPVVKGKRGKVPQFHWSLQCRAALDEAICVLERFVARHPEIDMLDFWPADGFYQLDERIYKDVTSEPYRRGDWEKHAHGASPTGRLGDPHKARLYALMIKPVAEALGRRFPDLKISTLHYVDLCQPCPEVALPANVVPFIAIYWRCIKHSLLDERCVYNRQFKQVLTEWTRQYPGRWICLYEYYNGGSPQESLPYPLLNSLFAEWEGLIKLGISGAHAQSGDCQYRDVSYNVNYLAFAALAWDQPPTRDGFLREYCRGFFGSAGRWVAAMYRLWEAGAQKAQGDTQPGTGFFGLMFSRARATRCRALLEKALRATHDPKAIYRIARLLMLMDYIRRVLTVSPWYLKKAVDQRSGKNTAALDRKILPKLGPIVQFVRRLQELGQDISGTSILNKLPVKDRLIRGDIIARREKNSWERYRGQIRKQTWALKAFNEDVAEAELAKRRRLNNHNPGKGETR